MHKNTQTEIGMVRQESIKMRHNAVSNINRTKKNTHQKYKFSKARESIAYWNKNKEAWWHTKNNDIGLFKEI